MAHRISLFLHELTDWLARAAIRSGPVLACCERNRTLETPSYALLVRREKVRSFSGCESRPAKFAPAGSNRSSRGGNEAAEAFDEKGH